MPSTLQTGTPNPTRARAYLAWAFVCLVWGTTYLAIRIALETIPPLLMGGIRFLVAGLLMIIMLAARGETLPGVRALPALMILGVLMLGLGNGGVVWAEQTVPSGLRSEEHTSELQSRLHLVCRLLLEKKKIYCWRFTPHTAISAIAATRTAAGTQKRGRRAKRAIGTRAEASSFNWSARLASSRFSSPADAKRPARSFSMALATMRSSPRGRTAFRREGGVGLSWRMASKIAAEVLPSNGGLPVAISYRTTPKEKMSVRVSSSCPSACSGDI